MDDRFSARMSCACLMLAIAVAGCEQGSAMQSSSGSAATSASAAYGERAREKTEAELALERRSAAMQRTIIEASGSGAALGGAAGVGFGLRSALIGAIAGTTAGASAGSYVALLQQEYENDEERLDRMIVDLDQANADAEAVLEAMRAVLAEQTAEIAAIRASIATDANAQAALEVELDSLQENVAEMQAAITGADKRLEDAQLARGILETEQAAPALDPRLGELSRRIAAMRDIATTLSQGA
jgi:hypothetical protein